MDYIGQRFEDIMELVRGMTRRHGVEHAKKVIKERWPSLESPIHYAMRNDTAWAD